MSSDRSKLEIVYSTETDCDELKVCCVDGLILIPLPLGELTDTLITHANSTLLIASYSNVPIGFTSAKGFTNNGLMQCLTNNYWGGGSMEITDGGLVNAAGAVLDILAPGTLSSSASPLYLLLQLENYGEVFFDHATIIDRSDAAHVNNGELGIQGHTISFNQTGTDPGFSNSGTLSIDENSTLAFNGGSFHYISGLLDVQGLISFTNATVNIIPAYTNTIHDFIHYGPGDRMTCVYHVIELFDDTPNNRGKGKRIKP